MARFLASPIWYARATIALAASCVLGIVLLVGERLLAPAGTAFAVSRSTFLFWCATGAIVSACGIRGGQQLLRTKDSRGDVRLVVYAVAAMFEFGSRSQILRYTCTWFSFDLGFAFDDSFFGLNPLGLLLFSWLLYLRGVEAAAPEQHAAGELGVTSAQDG